MEVVVDVKMTKEVKLAKEVKIVREVIVFVEMSSSDCCNTVVLPYTHKSLKISSLRLSFLLDTALLAPRIVNVTPSRAVCVAF